MADSANVLPFVRPVDQLTRSIALVVLRPSGSPTSSVITSPAFRPMAIPPRPRPSRPAGREAALPSTVLATSGSQTSSASERGRLKTVEMALAGKVNYDGDPDATSRLTHVLIYAMFEQKPGWEGGSVTVLQPDGTEAKFSPVYGKGIYAPWAISVDGNDNIWVSTSLVTRPGLCSSVASGLRTVRPA